jgi:hypothetical protein
VEVIVTFAPDHTSDLYSDGCRIELFGQEESHIFRLRGRAKKNTTYLEGGDDIQPDVESLSVVPDAEFDEGQLNAKRMEFN